MTRVLKSSLIAVLIILAVTAGLYYYFKYRGLYSNVLKAVPADAAMLFTVNNSDSIAQQILQSTFLQNYNVFEKVQHFQNSLNRFHSFYSSNSSFKQLIDAKQITISVHNTKADDFDLLFLMNTNGIENINFVISKLFSNAVADNARNYDGIDVHDIPLDNNEQLTYAYAEGILIASQTSFLVEDAIRQLHTGKSIEKDESLKKIIKDNSTKPFRIFINHLNLSNWLKIYLNQAGDNFNLKISGWSVLNVSDVFGGINFQGNTSVTDSMSVLSPFNNQQPRNLSLLSVLPANLSYVKASCFSDRGLFLQQFTRVNTANEQTNILRNKLSSEEKTSKVPLIATLENSLGNEFAYFETESSSIKSSNNSFAIVQLNDFRNTFRMLQQIASQVSKIPGKNTISSSYRGHKIALIDLPEIMPSLFGNDFKELTEFYFTDVRDFILIANQETSLRTFIDEFEKGNLLEKTQPFVTMKQRMAMNTNYFMLIQPARCYYSLKQMLTDSLANTLENNRSEYSRTGIVALSYANSRGLFNTTYYANSTQQAISTVNVIWNVQLDTTIIYGPEIVYATADSIKLIALQDDSLQFYLVDNSGNIVLKKQLSEKILGDISAIDAYKNGAREFLFNTSTQIYLFDVKGNEVSNFPIKLPSQATCSHAVFDYDKTLDYRIYIPCANGQVYGYQASGKPIPNWNYKSNSLIENPVQCFMKGNKEAITIVGSNGIVQLLDRTGKKLRTINEPFNLMPGSRFYASDNSDSLELIGLSNTGELWKTDSTGTFINLNLNDSGNISSWVYEDINADNKKDFIFILNNKLIIFNSNQAPLLSHTFNEPLNVSISIGEDAEQRKVVFVYGKQTNSVYAINLKGKMLNGFPVRSISVPVITDLNNDGVFKLITSSDSISVAGYSFQ